MDNRKCLWRIRDVFYVLLLYFGVVTLFKFCEAMLFGKEVLQDINLLPAFMLLGDIIDAITLTALPIFFITKFYKLNLIEIGITFVRFRRNLWLGLVVGIALLVVVSIFNAGIKLILGEIPMHPYIEKLKLAHNVWDYLAIFISILILSPIPEEVFLRGFAYTLLKKRCGKGTAVIVSSLIFAAAHLNFHWAAQIMIIGIGLALLFESTKSLVSVTIAHSLFNLLSVLISYI